MQGKALRWNGEEGEVVSALKGRNVTARGEAIAKPRETELHQE